MTSAQLILVSVSSALIAVIAMLVVATVLRARAREGTGSDLSQATGPQTRAQRAAARAQRRAQRATMRADKKAAKAAASVTKTEKKKAAAAALAAAKTEPADEKPATGSGAESPVEAPDIESDPAGKDIKSVPNSKDTEKDVDDTSPGDKPEIPTAAVAAESSTTPENTDELVVPDTRSDQKDEEIATTEAGKRAAGAKPKARRSLLGRGQSTEDSPEKKN
jgi:hypothetical protein